MLRKPTKPPSKSAVLTPSVPKLIQDAKGGNARAFEEIYLLYKGRVYALCFRVTKSMPDSEDLTQEVFMQVRRKLHGFRGDSAFSTWLYKVTFNMARMFLRKRNVQDPYFLASTIDETSTGAITGPPYYGYAPIRYLALKRAVASLPPGRRAVVILHDVNGLTHREIGLRLGIAPATSKTQLHHAHVKLRLLLSASHQFRVKGRNSSERIPAIKRAACFVEENDCRVPALTQITVLGSCSI